MNKAHYERITHHREWLSHEDDVFVVVSSLVYIDRGFVHSLGTFIIVDREAYKAARYDWRAIGKENFDRALEACGWSPPVRFHVDKAPAWWG